MSGSERLLGRSLMAQLGQRRETGQGVSSGYKLTWIHTVESTMHVSFCVSRASLGPIVHVL